MGFLGSIFGGIAKLILSPIISWVMSLLYSILIRGPLTLLNTLDHAFQYVSGSDVDKILFSTSLSDGHAQLNFFASSSPLKTFFLIMVGVAGALLVIFMGFMLASSVTKKGTSPMRKMAKVAVSTSIVFAIPVVFLSVLSLSGAVLGAISGDQIAMSSKNIQEFSKTTKGMLDDISGVGQSARKSFDDNWKITGMRDEGNNAANYSLSEIYTNLKDGAFVGKAGENQTLKQAAEDSYASYKVFRSLIVEKNNNGEFVINEKLNEKLNKARTIIQHLTPNMKDEEKADELKSLQNDLQNIADAGSKWVENSNYLMTFIGPDESLPINIAIQNFTNAFDSIYGTKANKELKNVSNIIDLQTLLQVNGYLISGNVENPSSGLIGLRQRMSAFTDSSLAVTFYQVATGNHDSNWDRSVGDFKSSGGYMLLIGFFLIAGACVIMVMAILWAVTRIFDLGLLFIVSPVIIVTSAFDDGARMKTWMNATFSKLIGIFGIVISLRLFGTLNTAFSEVLNNSSEYSGSSGFIVKQVIIGMFGLGGMLAAYKSTQTLSSIVGAGFGIMEGMQAGQISGLLRGGMRASKSMARGGALAMGLKTVSGGAGGYSSNGSDGSSSPRSRIGSIGQNWKARGGKVTSAVTRVTRGTVGTSVGKSKYMNNAIQKVNNKNVAKQQKRKIKTDLPKLKASYKSRNDRGGK